jgi:hypothetical protein
MKKSIKYIELVSKLVLLVTGGILIAEYITHPEALGSQWFLINGIVLFLIAFVNPVFTLRKRTVRRHRADRSALR